MDSRARDVLKIGDAMFSKKGDVDSLHQEIALNFYPERADFTDSRNSGDEFADHLFSSYPVLARRELGNLFASNLRPKSQKWFSIHVDDEELDEGHEEREYLERITEVQWRATYHPSAGFVKATRQADHDYAAFGNAVIQVTPNMMLDGMLYRNWHLRDNAWAENAEGVIDCNFRNWHPSARQLRHHFPDKISNDVHKACQKDPEKTFKCRHVVMPSRLYDYKSRNGRSFPFVSLYVECESETVLEETGLTYFPYVIPRWQTIAGTPWGRSMATSIALPDGRTMQVVVRVLREAGEKYVDPPMIVIADALRSDIALYAGGITTADIEYDERLGEVLRPVTQDKHGMPIGFEIAESLRQDIREAFFLDKIQLPESNKDMTAYETRRRIEESIRSQMPIFEPIEQEYNQPLCETTFHVLKEHGAFGPIEDMPESLDNANIRFSFRSPIADMADQNEAEVFVQSMERILLPAAQIDPAQLEQIDLTEATRDALRSSGFKASWFKDLDMVRQRQAELQKKALMQQGMEALGAAGQIAEQGGKGMEALNKAGAA